MIPQNLNNPACLHCATGALRDHALKFSMQGIQPYKAVLHLRQLALCNGINGFTALVGVIRQGQQFPNIVQRKTQFARMADKVQAFAAGIIVNPLPAFIPFRLGEQPDLFVVPDGWHFYTSQPRQFSDTQHAESP
jgi:hypothetical protein